MNRLKFVDRMRFVLGGLFCGGLLVLVYCAGRPALPGAAVLEAQTLPFPVNVGVDPDASGATMGYTVQLDAGAAVDVGLPAVNPACRAFVGGASTACVPFTVSVPSLGAHTINVVAYNLGGSSPAGSVSFTLASAPGQPIHLRVTK